MVSGGGEGGGAGGGGSSEAIFIRPAFREDPCQEGGVASEAYHVWWPGPRLQGVMIVVIYYTLHGMDIAYYTLHYILLLTVTY